MAQVLDVARRRVLDLPGPVFGVALSVCVCALVGQFWFSSSSLTLDDVRAALLWLAAFSWLSGFSAFGSFGFWLVLVSLSVCVCVRARGAILVQQQQPDPG